MTQQKSSPKTTPAPRATPRRVNASTDGHLSGKQMRTEADRQARDAAAAQVVEVYERLLAEQPIATELFTPELLRTAIEALRAELAK